MPQVHRLASGTSWIDLQFQQRPRRIAAGLVQDGAHSAVVIDPGPTSCLPVLEAALLEAGTPFESISHLLLTHIHLDHAGAAGVLARRFPHLRVVVHRRGAAHMTDPSRLLDSATRLYGDEMDRLWGRVEPVPEGQLVVLDGGERLEVAARRFEVAYTPGHAVHHVSFFDPETGIAWVGDTGGVAVDGGYVLPPTPPPDIDLPAWERSLERIGAWHPDTLFLTHCGPATGVPHHLQALADNLTRLAGWVREGLETDAPEDAQQAAFESRLRAELRRHLSEERAQAYESAAAFGLAWPGLARYWRKRSGVGGPSASISPATPV